MDDTVLQLSSILCQAVDTAATAVASDGGGLSGWLQSHGKDLVTEYGAWFIFFAFIIFTIIFIAIIFFAIFLIAIFF